MVFSKAKVALLKSKTLPTLELLAAFLAVKCLPSLLKVYSNVKFKNVFIAVKAQIILSWLFMKHTNNKNVFTKTRLKDIAQWEAELTPEFKVSMQYKYVSTGENPADLITRGLFTTKLKANLEYWTYEPSRLIDQPTSWLEPRK